MVRLETEKKALESSLADPDFYSSGAPADIQAASRRCGELGALIAADEERWLAVARSARGDRRGLNTATVIAAAAFSVNGPCGPTAPSGCRRGSDPERAGIQARRRPPG